MNVTKAISSCVLLFSSFAIASPAFAQMANSKTDWPDAKFRAENPPLSGPQITALYSGQTVEGVYDFPRKSVPTFQFEETHYANGRVKHIHGDRTDTGSWIVKGNQVCYRYDGPDMLAACFEVYEIGNCIYHYQKSVMGRPIEMWTNWSVIKGETPTCVNIVS